MGNSLSDPRTGSSHFSGTIVWVAGNGLRHTRSAEFRGLGVPEILSSGDHMKISRWRRERALEKTFRNRPDLLEEAELSKKDQEFLRSLKES